MAERRNNESGFTLLELTAVLIIFLVLVVVVILQVSGVFGGSREAAMVTDIHTVDTAISGYVLKSQGKVPTTDGNLPTDGEYALIDFNASFTAGGKTWTFYPDVVKKLPKHHDEGVWRINSKGVVSVDIDPREY